MPISNENLEHAYQLLEEIDTNKLIRKELGVDFNFEEAASNIRLLNERLLLIRENYDDILITKNIEEELTRIIERLSNLSKQIISFTVKDNPQASAQYANFNSDVEKLKNSFLQIALPLLNQIDILKLNPKKFKDEEKRIIQAVETSTKAQKEIENILEGARSASGETGTEISSKVFEDAAKKHRKLAGIWLVASTIVFSVSVFVTIAALKGTWIFSNFSINNFVDRSPSEIIHFSLFKFIIISLFYLALYQCLRSYKAHRHLQVLDMHRHNTLTVYPLMVNAAEGDNKQIILKEAARAIFDSGTTGYLGDDKVARPIHLNEIVNLIDKK